MGFDSYAAEFISMNISSKPKLLQKSKFFINYLNHLFYKKNIMISKISLNIFNKTIFLNFHLYFLSSLQEGKKKLFFKKIGKRINKFFKNEFKIFNVKTIIVHVFNLNMLIKRKVVKKIYYKFLKFERFIFLQTKKFFFNFINITYLIIRKLISSKCFLIIFAKLFVRLTKKSHSKFFVFIKVLINWCTAINNIFSKVKGIKFTINGRIKGKPRSGCYKTLNGKISCQTIISNIEYNHMHAYNRYGAFGLKLWVNY